MIDIQSVVDGTVLDSSIDPRYGKELIVCQTDDLDTEVIFIDKKLGLAICIALITNDIVDIGEIVYGCDKE
jgi:hypothetical protein